MVLVLTGIAVLAAYALASVYSLTDKTIRQSIIDKKLNAIKDVLPLNNHFDSKPIEMNDGVETMKVYKAYDKLNNVVGAAVETSSNNGYIGHIDVIVGFNRAGEIVNYNILEQNETPGLGSRMQEWFRSPNKKQSIIGKNVEKSNLSVSKDGGDIDAITAATTTSRAFLFAIKNAYYAFVSNIESTNTIIKAKVDSIKTSGNDSIANSNNPTSQVQ